MSQKVTMHMPVGLKDQLVLLQQTIACQSRPERLLVKRSYLADIVRFFDHPLSRHHSGCVAGIYSQFGVYLYLVDIDGFAITVLITKLSAFDIPPVQRT